MSHQTKRPLDSVECSTPHALLIRCSLSNLQFPAIALTWCGLTSHRHRSIEPFFMSLAARDSEFRRWSGRVDRRICQTFAASPAEPGELPLGFRLGAGDSRRSSSLLATNRAPPSLPETSIPLAIQRRAVRVVTPVRRAMSFARRYSSPPLISASPGGNALA